MAFERDRTFAETLADEFSEGPEAQDYRNKPNPRRERLLDDIASGNARKDDIHTENNFDPFGEGPRGIHLTRGSKGGRGR